MSAAAPALRFEAVDKGFGSRTILDGVSLRVEPGAAVVLRGPNGAGKSTLLACAAGTLVPDAGRIEIGGHDLQRTPLLARAALRYLPQEVRTPEGITGQELLELSAAIFEAPAADVVRAADATGLGDALARLASTYSVGMRRRLGFGTLLLGRAALFVLDEPFAGVDEAGRARLVQALLEAQADGAGIVVAAHDRDAADLAPLSARRVDLGAPAEPDPP